MRPFTFEKAESSLDALRLKKTDKKFIAGGTNLVDHLKKNMVEPNAVIDVTTALSKTIDLQGNQINIGAMARNTALANDATILEKFPIISEALLAGASPQIRNMASTAGNILQRTRCPYFYDLGTPCNKRKPKSGCSALKGDQKMAAIIGHNDQCIAVHPSDFCIALAVLEPVVVTLNSQNKSEKIPFKDFHKLPENTPWLDTTLPENSVITHLEIPLNDFKYSAYVKVRERTSYAFAMISCAALLKIENGKIIEARLASGGVAHKPWRWYEAEKFLKGKTPTDENFAKAADLIIAQVKPFEGNQYKVPMLKGAVELALKNALSS